MRENEDVDYLLQQIRDLHVLLYSSLESERVALQSSNHWRSAYLKLMNEFIELKRATCSVASEESTCNDELE